MLKSNFSERLKEAMSIQNIKAAEIARRSEILYKNHKINKPLTQSILSHYAKGNFEARQDNVYSIALILNVNEAWLMGADVPMERIENSDYDFLYVVKDESLMPLANIGDIAYLKKQNTYHSGQTILFSLNNVEYIRKIIDKEDSEFVEFISPNPYFATITKRREELELLNFKVFGKVISTKNSSAYEA